MNKVTISFGLCALWLACAMSQANAQERLWVEQTAKGPVFEKAILRSAFDPTTSRIAVSSNQTTIKVFDAKSLSLKATMMTTALVTGLEFAPDGSALYSSGSDGSLSFFSPAGGSPTKIIKPHETSISMFELAPDGKNLFTAGLDKNLRNTGVTTGATTASYSWAKEDLVQIIPLPSQRLLAATGGGLFQILSLPALLALTPISANGKITAHALSPDQQYLLLGYEDGTVAVWDVQALKPLSSAKVHARSVASLSYEPKQRWFVSTSSDSTLKISSARDFAALYTYRSPDAVYSGAYFADEAQLIAANSKGELTQWSVATKPPDQEPPGIVITQPIAAAGEEVPRIFGGSFEVNGIVYDNVSVSSLIINSKAVQLQPFSGADPTLVPPGKKSFSFRTQLQLDSTGVNAFVAAAADEAGNRATKRFTVRSLSNQEVLEIIEPAGSAETENISAEVKFKIWTDIIDYTIVVNLMKIVDGRIIMNYKPGQLVSTEVPLQAGYNQVQITVNTRSAGKLTRTLGVTRKLPAAMMPSMAIRQPKGPRFGPQRYALIVGVSEYKSPRIPALKYAHKDAEALAEFIQRPEGGGFPRDNVMLLTNKDATLENVKNGLVNFLKSAIDSDLVIIFFAGHGLPEPDRPQLLYLLTYDSDPSSLGTTAFPMWQIQDYLARYITSKRIVLFSDACHSGGITTDFATRGMATENNPINQYLVDLSRSKFGTIVFTASAAGEVSQELPQYQHGVFTYYLLKGLEGEADMNNDYTITIGELMWYVEDRVKRETSAAQNPTRSQTEYDKDLPIAIRK